MAIDPELLDILVCPETHQPVKLADDELLAKINQQIKSGACRNHGGQPVTESVESGLVREDGGCLYIVEGDIPNMLIDERIDLR